MVPRKLVSALAKAGALGLVLIALAGCPGMQQGGEGGEGGGGDMLMSILPLILIFVGVLLPADSAAAEEAEGASRDAD